MVNIFTARHVRQRTIPPLFDDPFFRRFFGNNLPGGGNGSGETARIQNSLGSGVLVDREGLVVTSHHVIAGSDEIKVVLSDKREFAAQIVSSDEKTDLAVLRIDPKGEALTTLPMGDSDLLEVGDLVLAIGNPFGVGQTVTSGIVSAISRAAAQVSGSSFFIQTDAAINPGNSGGALIDMDGRLVGVNTAIFSKSGGSHGIGFAIPTNMVKAVIKAAKSGGPVVRPWLGASGQEVTSEIAASLGLSRPGGVLVNVVRKNSPAQKAGLRVGDVVVAVAGQNVDTLQSLRFRIAALTVGREAGLDIYRGGKRHSIGVILIAPPEDPPRDLTDLAGDHPLDGGQVANLSPAFNGELNLDEMAQGVILLNIKRGSTIHRLGFKPGDIIFKINETEITSAAHLFAVLSQTADFWRISFRRDGRVMGGEFKR